MNANGIPDGWRKCLLGDLCDRIGVGLAMGITEYYAEHGTILVRNQNIRPDRFEQCDLLYLLNEFADTQTNKKLRAKDVITVRTGANIGDTCVVPPEFTGALTFTTLISSPKRGVLWPEFLSYYINSEYGRSEVNRLMAGGGKGNLNAGELQKFQLLLPTHSEQQKIADILSTWDRAIELTEMLIAAKQKRKQALMQQLLTGKVRFKEFEGKPWIRVPLGKLLKEVKRFVDWNDDAEYHLLSIRRRSGGMFDRETKSGHEIKTKVMMTTETGDFVIARMQAVHGAIAVTPPGCHGKHVSGSYSTFILRDSAKLHMPFLNYVSQTLAFYRLLLLSAYGVTIEKMTFNLPWFLSEKIDLPSTVEEQKRIANVFIAFDEENQLLVQRLERLKQQKKGLMQQLLTGKVRVNMDNETVKG